MAIAVRQLDHFDHGEWNRRVENTPEGSIHQSTHVEDFHKVTGGGYSPLYLMAEDETGSVLGQLALLGGFFVAPELVARPWLRHLLPWCKGLLRTYTWIQGPLVFDQEQFSQVLLALLAAVDEMAGRDACMVREASLPYYRDYQLGDMAEAALRGRGFSSQRRATFCVDLRQSPDALWRGLKPAARKNLKKLLAADELVVGAIDTDQDLNTYWQMLVETHRRDGRALSYRHLEDFAANFWARPHQQGLLHGFLVRSKEGIPLAGLLFRSYNGWIQELGVAYTDYSIEHKLYGQDLIKWHLIQWGQQRGCHSYDLMGVEPDSVDPKKRGIYQFKEKWGGTLVDYPVFAKTYSPWKAALIHKGTQVARRWRDRARDPR